MADAAQLRWRLPARPALRFRVGAAMADAIGPAPDPLPVAAAIGPRGQAARWITGTLGDGAEDEFIITHNFNSEAIGSSFWLTATGAQRQPDVNRIPDNPNAVRVAFKVPPGVDEFSYALFGPPA